MKHFASAIILLLIFSAVVLSGGDHDNGEHSEAPPLENGQESAAPGVAVTLWTEKMELFMEYPMAVANDPGRFIIHLTILEGFQPIREGSVTLNFVEAKGYTHEVTATELLREGIFTPTVELHDPGEYELTLHYQGPAVQDSFKITGFKVFSSLSDIPTVVDAAGGEIGFLKEQQWKIPFSTTQAELREMKKSVWAIGEVLPNPTFYVQITAPVDGIVRAGDVDHLVCPGSSVQKGEVVATIAPPVHGNGWVASQLGYEQAGRDYERAKRLRESQAISTRAFEQIENEYRTQKVAFEGLSANGGTEELQLTAPISGRIVEWNIQSGQHVNVGDKLMAIVDPSSVWLKVNVYENDSRSLGTPVGVYVKSGPDGSGVSIPRSDLRVLTQGGALDPATRTIPVLLEIANHEKKLRINEFAPVELYTSEGSALLSIPRSAIYEDEGMVVVYVQTGGESFEQRVVDIGSHHMGWTAIHHGIFPGERVVTTGGYHVKLAATTAEIGHGHAH